MPDHTPRQPTYHHYRPKILAVVRLGGRDVYLGKYGSDERREKYRRIVAEWLTIPAPADPALPGAARRAIRPDPPRASAVAQLQHLGGPRP